jgi:hypothetical protein
MLVPLIRPFSSSRRHAGRFPERNPALFYAEIPPKATAIRGIMG